MINPFKKIQINSRWIYNNRVIVVHEISNGQVLFYDLNYWWNNQTHQPILNHMPMWKFYLSVNKFN